MAEKELLKISQANTNGARDADGVINVFAFIS
jgi:hypothetical protein